MNPTTATNTDQRTTDPAATRTDQGLRELLDQLRAEHGVVGAQLAVDAGPGSALREAASGELNHELGTPVTPDALFQIGSISKVYTATLLMQLVDAGKLDLDVPVVDLLPGFALTDAARTARVTTRDLLSHRSGIEGDIFWDTGRGDDCVERFVDRLGEVGFVHPVGATASYSNAGFVVAGRIVEVLTGQGWDLALRERLLDPLGLSHSQTLPERMMRYAVAHGHEVGEDGAPVLVPRWDIPRASGPAGGIAATARDVCAFARVHLAGGRAPDGTAVLTEASVREMQTEQATAPAFGHRGLGWALYQDWSPTAYGHDGGTFGQSAFLRVVPDRGLAICLLTNGGDGRALHEELTRALLPTHDIRPGGSPTPPEPLPEDLDLTAFAGSYERYGARLTLRPEGQHVRGTLVQEDPMAVEKQGSTEELTFLPVAPDRLLAQYPGSTWMEAARYAVPDEGGADREYLHFAGRAARRVD